MHLTIYMTFMPILYYFTKHNKQDLRNSTTNSHTLTNTRSQKKVYIAKSHIFWAWYDLSYSATSA